MTSTAFTAGQKLKASDLNALRTGQLITASTATTVASTATETYFAVATIPANDMQVGMVYRIEAWGLWSNTGTPTLRWRNRIGTSATAASNASLGTTGALTTQSGLSNRLWMADWQIVVESTGVSGAVFGPLHVKTVGVAGTGNAPWLNDTTQITTVLDGVSAGTVDTTSANFFGLSATWGTSSSSNTLTCRGFRAERFI